MFNSDFLDGFHRIHVLYEILIFLFFEKTKNSKFIVALATPSKTIICGVLINK